MYAFRDIKQEEAEEIANNWEYEYPYDFYNMINDTEDYLEFIDESRRKGTYSVYVGDTLFGFFCVMLELETVDIALGMNPKYVSQGLGESFVNACLEFIADDKKPITLSVASFNERAQRVYHRCGFIELERFSQATNGSTFEFVKMIRKPLYD